MLFVDIETTGVEPGLNSIASIGAITEDEQYDYYGECHVAPSRIINKRALDINGFTRNDLTDKRKPSEISLVHDFFKWAKNTGETLLAGVNVAAFDVQFLKLISNICGSDWPFGYRTVDVHGIAVAVFRQSMSSTELSDVLGIPREKEPHNALRGAKHALALYKALLARIHG